MRKVLFSLCAVLAICNCSGLVGGDDSGLPSLGGGEYVYPPSGADSYVGKGNDIGNYRTVQIGSQRWMAENLNYYVSGSKCYNNNPSYCEKYGRLYDWHTALYVCPSGWHLPSKDEWDALASYIENDKNCSNCNAKHLKATSGWNNGGNGQDTYGFAALPGGFGTSGGSFGDAGYYGDWWSASEDIASYAYRRNMYYRYEYAYWYNDDKSSLQSVRCLQD